MTDLIAWADPLALALVVGGSVTVACIRASGREMAGALAAMKPLFIADPDADAEVASRAFNRAQALVETKNIVCVDRIETSGRFITEAVRRLSDARSSQAFALWAEDTLEARRRRHAGIASFWRSIADAAPSMGMIATVLGLIRMFRSMEDPSKIGAPMASALIATFLGLIVANVIAGPIAERLERLSAAELAWQRRTLDHFLALARAELDHAVGLQRTLARSVSK